jgi:hypothetical protein
MFLPETVPPPANEHHRQLSVDLNDSRLSSDELTATMQAALGLPSLEEVFEDDDNDADFNDDAYDNIDVEVVDTEEGEDIVDNANDANDANDDDDDDGIIRQLSLPSSGRPRSVSNPELPQRSILKLTPASMAALAVRVHSVSETDQDLQFVDRWSVKGQTTCCMRLTMLITVTVLTRRCYQQESKLLRCPLQ